MAFTLPDLPWSKDALAPVISPETIDFHYGKHHKTYVDNLNKLTAGTPQAEQSLETLIGSTSGGIFNNAAQVWNHTFYWNGLAAPESKQPSKTLIKTLGDAFGGFDKFKEQFANAAVTQFGSGWAWLVKDAAGKLEIVQTANAGNPLTVGKTPLLTCDVWEHAYYIDFRNARAKYVEDFWKIVNWEALEHNLFAK
jgi:Fe-Mn family superoxide dismutase